MWSLMLVVLITVKQQVVVCASNVFYGACIASLCQFVLKLFMCLLVRRDSKWRHVSFWWDMHRLHVGNMYCLRM
jgi:hypothetical protein